MKNIMLLSFPRSGNTLMRTVLESAFDIKTYGYNHPIDLSPVLFQENGFIDYRNDVLIIKRHDTYKAENFQGLIFILRNKTEAIESHIEKELKNHHNMNIELKRAEYSDEYERLIDFYNTFRGAKILIHYDKLIKGEIRLNEIATLFGLGSTKEIDFNKTKEVARNIYKKVI